jgi:transposase
VQVKDVAAALDIHPFMVSLWRKQVRERVMVARASKLDVETTAGLRRLRELLDIVIPPSLRLPSNSRRNSSW